MEGEVQKAIGKKLEAAAAHVEEQLDDAIERLQTLDVDELESIRKERVKEIKKNAQQLAQWKQNGHGEYAILPDEKSFFDVSNRSKRVVCHFYRESTLRCHIFDKHFKILATKHMETQFCKMNAEKSPFLCEKLTIKVMPTVMFLHDGRVIGRLTGFEQLDNHDEFSTELLDWVLGQYDIVIYKGDKSVRPTTKKPKGTKNILKAVATQKKKTIRSRKDFEDSSASDSG